MLSYVSARVSVRIPLLDPEDWPSVGALAVWDRGTAGTAGTAGTVGTAGIAGTAATGVTGRSMRPPSTRTSRSSRSSRPPLHPMHASVSFAGSGTAGLGRNPNPGWRLS